MRYSRLFYEGLQYGMYFLDTFNRGIVFYTVNNSTSLGYTTYLKITSSAKATRRYGSNCKNAKPYMTIIISTNGRHYNKKLLYAKVILMTATKIIAICLLVGLMVFTPDRARTQEPAGPGSDRTLSPAKVKKIDQLAAMPIPEVFTILRSPEFLDEEEYLNKAIYTAFNHRSEQAVQFALGYVRSTQLKKIPTGTQDFYIAKQTLQIFPDQSWKACLIYTAAGGPKSEEMSSKCSVKWTADNPSGMYWSTPWTTRPFARAIQPESTGEPLRICDVAYNQIVIRYKIKNVPRVIGSIHAIDMRDHHIQILKDMLAAAR